MTWNPNQYHKFKTEREQPFNDLLQLINIRPNLQVIDLGCGTGELTAQLHDLLPYSQVLGIDSSAQMLEKAQGDNKSLRFELKEIQDLQGQWDIIFSNAALQWLPDHQQLIPQLFSRLKPQGQLIVQLPSNKNHIAYRLIQDLIRKAPFRDYLQGFEFELNALGINDYAETLYNCRAANITVLEKVYPCIMEDYRGIIEWVKGTALTPYLQRLSTEQQAEFLAVYAQDLQKALPQSPLFFGFRRILFAASMPE